MSNSSLPKKTFYIADCAIEDIAVDPNPTQKDKVEAWAVGRVILVSGDVELHFNWVAQGGDSLQAAFNFEINLDDEEPDFQLEGLGVLSGDEQQKMIKRILDSSPWRAEILECLPKNQQELAALK